MTPPLRYRPGPKAWILAALLGLPVASANGQETPPALSDTIAPVVDSIAIVTENRNVNALSLAPMAVLPDWQRQGIGSQLADVDGGYWRPPVAQPGPEKE